MGKITVETCEIEGLKVITPTVFGDERGYLWKHIITMIIKKRELTWNLFRIISQALRREY